MMRKFFFLIAGLILPGSVALAALSDEEMVAPLASPVECSLPDQSGGLSEQCLKEEAFWSAQWAMQGASAQALSAANARFAKGTGELAELAQSLELARESLADAEKDHFAALALGDGEFRNSRLQQTAPALASAKAKLAVIDAQIAERFPEYAELVAPKPLSLSEAQDLLRDEDIMLLVLPGETGTFTFLATRDDLEWHKSDLSREELAVIVDELRLSMGVDGAFDGGRAIVGAEYAFDRRTAFSLYADLFGPLAEQISGAPHIYFVASGPLTAFPLGALVTQAPEGDDFDPEAMRSTSWLQRSAAITVLPSPASLKALASRGEVNADRAFLGVGNACTGWGIEGAPQPPASVCGELSAEAKATLEKKVASTEGTRGVRLSSPTRAGGVAVLSPDELRFSLDYLPGTREELLALSQTFGGDPENDLLLGPEASESRLRSEGVGLTNRKVIAFATHGLIATDGIENLDEPGLVMTPPAKGTPADDGFLAASEIAADLRLDADFVILSACNTASPAKSGADSLSGLAQAFFYAGARSLLVSHWPVQDDVAPKITTGTVRNFEAAAEAGRAAALKQAIEPLMDDPATADPYFWAPFVLVGQNLR